jgi:polyhydroxybutyrate depolymerase
MRFFPAWRFLLWALICLPQMASAQVIRRAAPTPADIAALGFEERTLRVGGVERRFLVQPAPDASRPALILIVLHGGGQSMRRLFAPDAGATRGWPGLARRENALLLVPNGLDPDSRAPDGNPGGDNQNWNDLREGVARETRADDVGFVLALIDWAQQNHRVDRSRVYVTGASNGGMMTFRLLIEAPERFAAGAAFVAALPRESSRIRTPATATPLLIANGTLDPLVQWGGGPIAGGRGETRSVESTVEWWVAANHASLQPGLAQALPDSDTQDRCTIERREFAAGPGGAPVVAYTMRGGGHNIPSARYALADSWAVRRFIGPVCRDAEGIELAWTFLSAHRR